MMMEQLEVLSVSVFHEDESLSLRSGHVEAGETGPFFHGNENPLLIIGHVDMGETSPSFHGDKSLL